MPYIGKQLVRGQNRKLDDISSGFNGSQTTFTLQIASQNVSVGSALQLWISVGGVIQNPLTDFTIAGNQITFTTAPAASLDFFGVIQGDVTDTNTPGDATVTTSKLSTGLTVNLADGSAATSSLQLGGTDSGLFSSAADKVNVTTGGVERLEIGNSEVVFNDGSNDVNFRVESNGNTGMLFVDGGNDRVGIGTTSPANNLDIAVDANNEGIQISSSTNVFGKIDFHANRSGADAALGILDFNWNNTQVARIIGGTGTDTTNKDDGVLQFHTAAAGSASEAMRIDSSGNVGIGTTSPGEDLHVFSSAGAIKIDSSGDSALRFAASGTNKFSIFQSGGTLRFFDNTNNAERMRIDSSGNVGIGASSPAAKLDIAGNQLFSAANPQIQFNAGGPIIRLPSANTLAFLTDSSNERMRIDSSGRLLVGTSASLFGSNNIQSGNTGGNNFAGIRYTTGAGGAQLVLGHSQSGTIGSNVLLSNDDYIGSVEFRGADGTNYLVGAGIDAFVDGTPGTNDMPGRLVFSTCADGASSPTERMRISQNGGINTFSASDHYFAVRNNGTSSSLNAFIVFQGATATTNGTPVMVVRQDGDLENANNNYGSLSDVKLKENIVDAGSQWNDLKTLQVRKYNFKAETGYSTHTQIGLIAQEIELVSPGLVSESPDKDGEGNDLGTTTKAVSYSVLYMKAIKALQEAMTRIETLETQNASFEARLTALEGGAS